MYFPELGDIFISIVQIEDVAEVDRDARRRRTGLFVLRRRHFSGYEMR
jgi:hypothetical protein